MSSLNARRGFLFGALALLGIAQLAALGLFSTRSEDFVVRNHNDRASAYARDHVAALPALLVFDRPHADSQRLGMGWHAPDAEGTWSYENDAWLFVATDPGARDLSIALELAVYLSEKTPGNRIDVSVDGVPMGTAVFDQANPQRRIELRVPAAQARGGALAVRLHVEHCVSPLREGSGAEARRLGVLLHAVEVRDAA